MGCAVKLNPFLPSLDPIDGSSSSILKLFSRVFLLKYNLFRLDLFYFALILPLSMIFLRKPAAISPVILNNPSNSP